ncbi:MAG TPA: carboxylating nicotinate-nucleotide diphosphorylase [Burkholderiales bacterium]|jgi:nicotinate-nucleotide pyrophosphorylase (carboxylating)|nr:carboxylating nicotinate-nucleotide diphosphorylase [Burkholderiales bacterium]
MSLQALPDLLVEPLIRAALTEDLGRAGDITTQAIFPAGAPMRAVIAARKPGILAGIQAARLAFKLLDPAIDVEILKQDGATLVAGDEILRVSGDARAVLSAERVALNFSCRLSGIATATAQLVEAAKPHKARIACTRKTTPGLRALEKYAVRAGGGVNHRFGLDDAVLIKDNHIAVAGGVHTAIERARASVGHLVKIEVEVDTLAQLDEALSAGVDAVLLDNMTPDQLREAVWKVNGRAIVEASGGVTLATVQAIAATGVDIISAGWLTHSAPILDLGLDVL